MSKQTPIKILEEALKFTKEQLEDEIANIKTLKDQAAREEGQTKETRAEITSLQDALHKLKGLDNLEKKNKIADPGGSAHPDYVVEQKIKTEKGFVVKNVTGFDIHKFARDLILPDIIEMLKDRKFTIIEEGK